MGNLWVYGMDIFLAGWICREDFRRKARVIYPGMSTFQYAHTRTKNLAVPLTDLEPLPPLLEKVKQWTSQQPRQEERRG